MKTTTIVPQIRAALVAACLAPSLSMADSPFTDFPAAADPVAVGTRVAKRFAESTRIDLPKSGPTRRIIYPEVITWYGALTFAKTAGLKDVTGLLVERFEPLHGDMARLMPKPDHVDNNMFGSLPLEIYMQNGDKRCLELGRRNADLQWEPPADTLGRMDEKTKALMERGLSWQTRFWIDDMYMITIVQTQMFRASKDTKYLDRAAKSMVAYLDELQKPNGLFHHSKDAPFFWGRGNGWVAAGMAELLRSLPKDHPDRPRILAGCHKMMDSLLTYQGADGMWRQLVDDPDSWPESSCSGMFTFAMITGCKEGWLDTAKFGPAARKGWTALAGYVRPNGVVRDVCVGTNTANNRDHYLERPRADGDLHGQGPVLWCATALLREPAAK